MISIPETVLDENKDIRESGIKALRGCLSQYANPELIKKEKDAWGSAMEEKHDIEHRMELLSGHQKYRGRLPKDFNAEKELVC